MIRVPHVCIKIFVYLYFVLSSQIFPEIKLWKIMNDD